MRSHIAHSPCHVATAHCSVPLSSVCYISQVIALVGGVSSYRRCELWPYGVPLCIDRADNRPSPYLEGTSIAASASVHTIMPCKSEPADPILRYTDATSCSPNSSGESGFSTAHTSILNFLILICPQPSVFLLLQNVWASAPCLPEYACWHTTYILPD